MNKNFQCTTENLNNYTAVLKVHKIPSSVFFSFFNNSFQMLINLSIACIYKLYFKILSSLKLYFSFFSSVTREGITYLQAYIAYITGNLELSEV